MQVFLNHDHDRLDVTLALPASPKQTTSATTTRHATTDAETARVRARLVAGHGLRAPPNVSPASATTTTATNVVASASMTTTAATDTEVIHTTSNHPWLTADHGWLLAGTLHVGEPVRLLDGGMARVVALRTLPGVGAMWDLSLDDVHTFAVGAVQAVVHNCPLTGDDDVGSGAYDLYHGTDIKSAKTMVNKGIDRVAADQYGGDGKFYTTTNLANARTFAEVNPAGGPPAVVGIKLSTGLSGAVEQGFLTPMEGFPGAYTVEDWEAFNRIATFTLVGFEP